MGRLFKAGERRVRRHGNANTKIDNKFLFVSSEEFLVFFKKPRIGYNLGTGWSNPDVLNECGFKCEAEISFESLGLNVKSGSGHPHVFKFGTWHGKDVVLSCGRVQGFSDRGFGHDSTVRQWVSLMVYFMNGSKQIVTTAAVGGISDQVADNMLVMPTGMMSSHLTSPHLIGEDGEIMMFEHLLWSNERKEIQRNRPVAFYTLAANDLNHGFFMDQVVCCK